MKKHSSLIFIISLIFTSCSFSQILNKITPDADRQFCDSTFSALQQNDYDYIFANSIPELKQKLNRQLITTMSNYIPEGQPEITQINYKSNSVNGLTSIRIDYEYKYANDLYLVYTVAFQKADDVRLLSTINFNKTNQSLKEPHKFTFKGKSIQHYIFFVLAILFPLYSIFMFVIVVRQKKFKGKIFWAIFVLAGIMSFTLNWTNGSVNFSPLTLRLLSASVECTPYSPIKIGLSIPLGAFLFWIKLFSLKHKSQEKEI